MSEKFNKKKKGKTPCIIIIHIFICWYIIKTNDSDLFERRWLLSGIFCLLMLLTWTVFLVGEKTFLYRPIRAWPTIIFFKFYGRFFRPMLAALSRHQTMRMSRFVHVSIHSPLTIANSLLFTWKKLFFFSCCYNLNLIHSFSKPLASARWV